MIDLQLPLILLHLVLGRLQRRRVCLTRIGQISRLRGREPVPVGLLAVPILQLLGVRFSLLVGGAHLDAVRLRRLQALEQRRIVRMLLDLIQQVRDLLVCCIHGSRLA